MASAPVPSQPHGQANADEHYNRYFLEYHPNYKEKVYRVPPVHFGRPNSRPSRKRKRPQPVTGFEFQVYSKSQSDVIGDTAEARVSDSIEHLLNHWVTNKQPAFIITSFKFENFCNQTSIQPVSDENRYTEKHTSENTTAIAESKLDGEHDILIVHYKFGIIAIQVKGCKSPTDPNNNVKEAIKQLEKDRDFFKANFEDLRLGVSFTAIVALPFISLRGLKKHAYACNRLHKHSNCQKATTECKQECLQRCLLDDNLPLEYPETEADNVCRESKLREWWCHITENCEGFKSWDNYKRFVARYIGYKSTVPIRNLSQSVSETGSRCMNIVLTFQQTQVLVTTPTRLVIRGEYGSGKTVLLILKARILLLKTQRVCIISMGHSPLIPVLEESIKYNMKQQFFPHISFVNCSNENELKTILVNCGREGRHVLIDEFPSDVYLDEDLRNEIRDYPPDLTFWCIMSCEKGACLTKGPQYLFNLSPSEKGRFWEIVMNKVLRCPPSVMKHVRSRPRKFHDQTTIFAFPGKKDMKTNVNSEKMAKHFQMLGLSTSKINYVTPSDGSKQSICWSDIIVIVDKRCTSSRLTEYYNFLNDLDIPLITLTNANDFLTKEAILFVSEIESDGFIRKEVIYFEPDKVVANPEMPDFQGGPPARFIDHTGHVQELIYECDKCQTELNYMLTELGLKAKTPLRPSTQSRHSPVLPTAVRKSQNLLSKSENPDQELTYSDMVILDDRRSPQSAAELFRKCQVPVVDKLDVDRLNDEEAFGSNTRVIYTKPRLFQGLERKIVVIITRSNLQVRHGDNSEIVDSNDLAVTRCSSQLIFIHC